jgi:phosphoglycerate dehydrogenase-like enzyme
VASESLTGRGEVLVTWPDYDLDADDLGGALRRAGLEIRLAPKRGDRTPSQMAELVGAAAAAIVSTDPFDAAVLAGAPNLRAIARVGVGTDSIDLAAATDRGVVVTIARGVNEATVADHTLALMLAAVRRICEHDAGVRAGEWNRTGPYMPWLLSGKTVGLVGYGTIGRLVARRLQGFDVKVLAFDVEVEGPGEGADVVALDELLAASQIVSLHVPLVPGTRGLIGARELGLMQRDAILVNTARGGVVDEGALLAALESGHLRGAALDVFEEEPPRTQALLSRRDVVFSPHNGGISDESVREMTRRATASVIDVLGGRAPQFAANPDAVRLAGLA